MDYEKAYKESFGVAKCLHETGDVITKKQMERLFPQLVESDDEWNWRKVRRAIRGFFTNPIDANELLAWLEKKKEQNIAEWSEEDKRCFDEAIEALESLNFDGEASNLKSLRDRRKPLNTWKPSEKQMKALSEAVYTFDGYEESDAIKSLYNDLKKLM